MTPGVRSRDPLRDPESLISRVYAYVAYRIGDGPDAEDVTSETFERALRYRRSYDAARGDAGAWLIGIARRCLADHLATAAAIASGPELVSEADVEEETVRRLTLAGALNALDEHDRELIALRYGADLTARQIAELHGVRTNTVEVALHRALARLRSRLEPTGAGPSEELGPRASGASA
jgi:RNA polymerase sigma-70 factor, ECF subfamily